RLSSLGGPGKNEGWFPLGPPLSPGASGAGIAGPPIGGEPGGPPPCGIIGIGITILSTSSPVPIICAAYLAASERLITGWNVLTQSMNCADLITLFSRLKIPIGLKRYEFATISGGTNAKAI